MVVVHHGVQRDSAPPPPDEDEGIAECPAALRDGLDVMDDVSKSVGLHLQGGVICPHSSRVVRSSVGTEKPSPKSSISVLFLVPEVMR